MTTMTVQAEVSAEGILKLEVPCLLTPGPVEVVLTIQPCQTIPRQGRIDWGQLSGLGAEVWQGIDGQRYLDELRADREPGS